MANTITPIVGVNSTQRTCFQCRLMSSNTKQLSCSHIFCISCLEGRPIHQRAGNQLTCPLRPCGKPFTIPASGLSGLPTNSYPNHLRVDDVTHGISKLATEERGAAGKPNESTDNHCVICMDEITSAKKLGCGHTFCTGCIDDYFVHCQPKCPSCGKVFGVLKGNQPPGTFHCQDIARRLAGYEQYNTIMITYQIPSGIQSNNHPRPGVPFSGTTRYAYLPASPEGREVCGLLRRAFDAGMIFTIGRSHTTGLDNTVVWNDVHHKTDFTGQYGYPDPTYLTRVKYELADKGISL